MDPQTPAAALEEAALAAAPPGAGQGVYAVAGRGEIGQVMMSG